VGIIGLGLMGGSLALALRPYCRSICGHDIDSRVIDQALDRGLIDQPIELSGDQVDVLILAAPVIAILDWLDRSPSMFGGEFHVIDLGSTKAQIVAAMRQLPERISPLGGHPMCGKETSGLGAADPDLYRRCLFVLAPLDRTQPATLTLAQDMIAAIGARSLLLDADRHDRLAAAISHVPYLTSLALVDATLRANDDVAWAMAASGFRDSTRLAASDVTMMLDILTSNRAAILESLVRVQSSLHDLIQLVDGNDVTALRDKLIVLQERRRNL
jgi:prephenate dehydrogenase